MIKHLRGRLAESIGKFNQIVENVSTLIKMLNLTVE